MRRLAIVPISLLVTILYAAGLPAHAQKTAYKGGEVADGSTVSGKVSW